MKKLNQTAKSLVLRLDSCNFSRVQHWIFPLSFVFSSFLNLAFFYIGLAFEDNPIRSAGYIIGCIVFAVLSAVALVYTLHNHSLQRKQWILLSASIGFFLICLGTGVLRNGFGSKVFNYLKVFIVLVIPSFFASCVFGMKREESAFFRVLEQVGFFSLPVVVLYVFWAVFNCNPFYRGIYLGFMNYMSFAYTIMPILLAHIQQFSVEAPLKIPFLSRTIPHAQRFRAIVIVLYWLAIIASGTRGAYMCVAAFCVFLFLNKLIRRKSAKRFFTLSAVLALILFFLIFIYAPPGFSGVGRMSSFVQSLVQGNFSTSDTQSEDVDEQIGDLLEGGIVVSNPDAVPSTRPGKAPSASATHPNKSPTEPFDTDAAYRDEITDDDELLQEEETAQLVISDRSTYYKLAIGEFQNSPLFGMGPGGYSQKYASYPHNIILEIVCETGLVGTLYLAALLILAASRICLHAIKNETVCDVLLFFLVYFIQANISGSVWQSTILLCILGYGFSLPRAAKKQ